MSNPSGWSPWGSPSEPSASPRRLGPLRVIQLLEIGSRILRRHWRGLLAVGTLILVLPSVLDSASSEHFWDTLTPLAQEAQDAVPFSLTSAQLNDILVAIVAAMATTLLSGAFGAVATLGFARYVDHDYRGEEGLTAVEALRFSLRRGVTAFVVGLINGVAVIGMLAGGALLAGLLVLLLPPPDGGTGGIGVFLALLVGVAVVVTAVTIAVRWSVAAQCVALEEVGPLEALRRSWYLTGDNAWRTFGLTVLVNVVVSILSSLIAQLIGVTLIDGLDPSSALVGIISIAGDVCLTLLFAPVLPVMLTTLYFDLRVRRERFDLPMPEVGGLIAGDDRLD